MRYSRDWRLAKFSLIPKIKTMILFSIFLIIFWIIIIIFPELLVYLIWGFFIMIWINILLANVFFIKKAKKDENYIKFWKYKIYR